MTIYEHKLKNAYIGEYIEKTFTLSDVPDGDVNKYISIAKSGYKVSKVKFKYSNTITVRGNNNWVRISGNNNTVNRYGIGYTDSDGIGQVQVNGNINSQDVTFFYTASRGSGTSNIEFTIEVGKTTLISTGATNINTSWTQTSAEQNIVSTIMNSNTINAYSSRDGGGTVSDIQITVTYEQI